MAESSAAAPDDASEWLGFDFLYGFGRRDILIPLPKSGIPAATEYIKIEEIKPQPRVIQRGIGRSDLAIMFKRE